MVFPRFAMIFYAARQTEKRQMGRRQTLANVTVPALRKQVDADKFST